MNHLRNHFRILEEGEVYMHSSVSSLASTFEVRYAVCTLLCDVTDERPVTVLICVHRISNELVRFEHRSNRYPLKVSSCVVNGDRHSVDGEFFLSGDSASMMKSTILGVFLLGITDTDLGDRASSTSLG